MEIRPPPSEGKGGEVPLLHRPLSSLDRENPFTDALRVALLSGGGRSLRSSQTSGEARGPTRRVPDPARGKRIKPREPRTQRAATDWQGGSEPTSSNRHSIIEWKGTGVRHPQTPVRLHHRPLGDPPMTAPESLSAVRSVSIATAQRSPDYQQGTGAFITHGTGENRSGREYSITPHPLASFRLRGIGRRLTQLNYERVQAN